METNAIENMTLEELKVHEEELKGQVPRDVVGLNRVQDRITQLEAHQVKIQQEDKVESDPIPIAVAGVDLTKLDPELIQLIELVTKADRRARNVDFNTTVESIQNDHKQQLANVRDELDRQNTLTGQANQRELDWKNKHDELDIAHTAFVNGHTETISQLQNENAQLKLEKQDAEAKRDAAVKDKEDQKQFMMEEIASRQNEINRLRLQVEEYQRAKVFGERDAQKIIDITPEETNKAQNLVDSLAKKFVSATPIGANWHEAIDEHGNKTIVHTDDLPKEQVLPFRTNELDQTHVEHSATTPQVAEVTAPDVQFPVNHQEIHSGHTMVDTNSPLEMAGETVSRAEFEALKGRVSFIEAHGNIPTNLRTAV